MRITTYQCDRCKSPMAGEGRFLVLRDHNNVDAARPELCPRCWRGLEAYLKSEKPGPPPREPAPEPVPADDTDGDPLLTADEVGKWLQVQTSTLTRWRNRRIGPDYLVLEHLRGKPTRYRKSAVDRYIESCTHESTQTVEQRKAAQTKRSAESRERNEARKKRLAAARKKTTRRKGARR